MIKSKIIKTEKAELLVVGGLPEDARDFKYFNDKDKPYLCYIKGIEVVRKYEIPAGNWQLLGKLEEITEEQWEMLVGVLYEHYKTNLGTGLKKVGFVDYKYPQCTCITVTESGLSLIEANVKLENKYGEIQPNRSEYNFGFGHNETERYEQVLKDWQREEERVFRNLVIFVKGNK